jgi:hypothetical protein
MLLVVTAGRLALLQFRISNTGTHQLFTAQRGVNARINQIPYPAAKLGWGCMGEANTPPIFFLPKNSFLATELKRVK